MLFILHYPKIKGKLRIFKHNEILREARKFAGEGIKELNIIAQDVTATGRSELLRILRDLIRIKPIKWVRLLYLNPWKIDEELMNFIVNEEKMCKYVDIPIQHVNNYLLRKMNRAGSRQSYEQLFSRFREKAPEIAIRTTIMVGFPGETESRFDELKDFISKIKFDRLGVFKYSKEEGTPAYFFSNQVPERIKEKKVQRNNEITKTYFKGKITPKA